MSVVLSHPSSTSTSSTHMATDALNALPLREYMSSATPQRQPASTRSAKAPVSATATNDSNSVFVDVNNENSSSDNNQLPLSPHAQLETKACKQSALACDDSALSSATVSSSGSHISRCSSSETAASVTATDTTALDDCDNNAELNDDDADDADDTDDASAMMEELLTVNTTAPPMSVRTHAAAAGRFSESAVPEKLDPEFVLPVRPQDYKSTRSSLVSFEASAKSTDGAGANFTREPRRGGGNSNFVDLVGRDSIASDGDAFQFFDDGESSRLSSSVVTPRSLLHTNPYDGISIDVNNHSINNQGVVLYHVDIKGPEGLLSTYTIRRRYRAFKELHQKLQALITEYTAQQSKTPAAAVDDAFSAENVPDSPHTQARQHAQRLQQIAEHSVLSASFTFPALPNGGVWSYLKRHDVRLVEQRKKRFEEILRIAIRHPATKTSAMLDSFLSVAPSLISQRGSSYVSLMDYSVPVFDRQRESIERKQLKRRLIEGRRQRTSSEASSSQS